MGVAVDKTEDISESAQDKPEVDAGGNEDTGILNGEKEELEELMKETAVDRTGDISESAQDKVEDLKVAGSKILEVVKEKVEELKGKKEEKVEELKGKKEEKVEELKAAKEEKVEE